MKKKIFYPVPKSLIQITHTQTINVEEISMILVIVLHNKILKILKKKDLKNL